MAILVIFYLFLKTVILPLNLIFETKNHYEIHTSFCMHIERYPESNHIKFQIFQLEMPFLQG